MGRGLKAARLGAQLRKSESSVRDCVSSDLVTSIGACALCAVAAGTLHSMKAQTSGIAGLLDLGTDFAEQAAAWSGEDSNWSGATGAGGTVLQRLGSALSKVPLQLHVTAAAFG